jgi:hypothetical protein
MRLSPALLTLLALAGSANPSCGNGNGNGNGATASPEAACSDLAEQFCTRLSTCAPFALQIRYADVAHCAARRQPICLAALKAAGTGATPASVEACSRLFNTASCDDTYIERYPQGCTVAGSLGAGAPCGDDSQCTGPDGHCKIDVFETCGACATLGAIGASCSLDQNCAAGLICGGPAATCVVPVAEGSPCDDQTLVCAWSCTNGRCMKRLGLGAPCDPKADLCDSNYGYCDAQAKVCSAFKMLALGTSCNNSASGTFCANGTCGAQGTCVPNASDGDACHVSTGPACTNPAVCVNGVCVLPNATQCH